VLDLGDTILNDFENKIMAFEPSREVEKIAHAEVIRSLSDLIGNRGDRIQSVSMALPGVLWVVVLIGAILNVGLTYCFWVDNLHLHSLLVIAFSSMLAMLIFLTAAMDNPFRGEFSVSPDALVYVRDHVMIKASN
jgi:hypothetical protein